MNHQSWIDNLIAVVYYHPAFMIKAEVEKVPIISTTLAGLEVIYVQRTGTKEERDKAI